MKFCKTCGGFFEDEAELCPADGAPLVVLQGQGDDPLLGQVLDRRYRILSQIGRGGMGTVYRALQTSTRREIALKVIRGDLSVDATRRFMVEAHTTSALRNVHTVTIYDFGQAEDGLLYLAMELLQGRSLEGLLAAEPRLPWRRALRIVAQVAESLQEAHEKGIVHRDLKPGNILLVPMGDDPDFVKVLDFGIAKLEREGMTTNLTGTGMVLGTPRYMSPEQARGEVIDARCDLYSLGVLLFECLVGRPPFEGEHPLSVMMKHCQDPPPSLAAALPGQPLPEGIQHLLDGLLAKQRDERIASAAEVRERVRTILEGEAAPASLAALELPSPAPPATAAAPLAPATPAPTGGSSASLEAAALELGGGRGRIRWLLAVAFAVLVAGAGAWALLGSGGGVARDSAADPAAASGGAPEPSAASSDLPDAGVAAEPGADSGPPAADLAPPPAAAQAAGADAGEAPAAAPPPKRRRARRAHKPGAAAGDDDDDLLEY